MRYLTPRQGAVATHCRTIDYSHASSRSLFRLPPPVRRHRARSGRPLPLSLWHGNRGFKAKGAQCIGDPLLILRRHSSARCRRMQPLRLRFHPPRARSPHDLPRLHGASIGSSELLPSLRNQARSTGQRRRCHGINLPGVRSRSSALQPGFRSRWAVDPRVPRLRRHLAESRSLPPSG